jgi:hypothetical protein
MHSLTAIVVRHRVAIECSGLCLAALVVDGTVLPLGFMAIGPLSNSGVVGLFATALTCSMCIYAFFRCPLRSWVGKIFVTVVMSVVLLVGVHEWLVQAIRLLD